MSKSQFEDCPWCKNNSVMTELFPNRNQGPPQSYNEVGDRRVHRCTRPGCGWRSEAVWRKGRSPNFPREPRLLGFKPDGKIADQYLDRRWRWPDEEPFIDRIDRKVKEYPVYSRPLDSKYVGEAYWEWTVTSKWKRP